MISEQKLTLDGTYVIKSKSAGRSLDVCQDG